MKKIILSLVFVFSIGTTTFANSSTINKENNSIVITFGDINCYDEAQSYYEFLVNEEGVDPITAGKRARKFRDYCEEAQKNQQ